MLMLMITTVWKMTNGDARKTTIGLAASVRQRKRAPVSTSSARHVTARAQRACDYGEKVLRQDDGGEEDDVAHDNACRAVASAGHFASPSWRCVSASHGMALRVF
jgi:hypothetical protein